MIAITISVTFVITVVITALISIITTSLYYKYRYELREKIRVNDNEIIRSLIIMDKNPAYVNVSTERAEVNNYEYVSNLR